MNSTPANASPALPPPEQSYLASRPDASFLPKPKAVELEIVEPPFVPTPAQPAVHRAHRHFASDYIGKKWVNGARGPDKFDCWGLCYYVLKKEYDTDVPSYLGVDAKDLSTTTVLLTAAMSTLTEWAQVDTPEDGCIVAMGMGADVTHVGIYLDVDGGTVLHCMDRMGVLCQRIQTLANHRLSIHGYYVPRSWLL